MQHLAGLAGLLELCVKQRYRSSYDEQLFKHCRQYLIYHLIMAKATFPNDYALPDIQSTLTRLSCHIAESRSAGALQDSAASGESREAATAASQALMSAGQHLLGREELLGDPYHIEPHQGFSNTLLFLINDISELSLQANSTEGNESDLMAEAVRIEQSLIRLEQPPPPFHGQVNATTEDTDGSEFASVELAEQKLRLLTAHAEANRSAALLLLNEACRLRQPKIHQKLQSSRSDLVEDILSFTETICNAGIITAALPIWAVFVAGCTVTEASQRQRVLKIMDDFQSTKRYGSIPPARSVLEMVWRQDDLKADENPRKVVPNMSIQQHPPRRRHSRFLHMAEDCSKSATSSKRVLFSWERAMDMAGGLRLSLT